MAQLAFDLPARPAFGGADFFVTPANAAALAWVERWPAWPGPVVVVHGPPGSGKTHLGRVFARHALAACVDGPALAADAVPRIADGHGAVLVDDADRAPELALLHLCNYVAGGGGHLLLTAAMPPAAWGTALADLRSRLLAAPSVALAAPDDALLEAVLVKLFADRQVRVAPAVPAYLVRRMERSFDAARRLVAALDAAALGTGGPIGIALARRVLDAGS